MNPPARWRKNLVVCMPSWYTLKNMKDCPFCGAKDRIIKETPLAQVILSNPRKMPGHFLVMPKRHIEAPWELTEDELKDIFQMIFEIEQKTIGKLGNGFDVRQNYRPYVQQGQNYRVSHVHFHLYPRFEQDYLYKVAEQYEKDLFTELDPAEQDEIIEMLK